MSALQTAVEVREIQAFDAAKKLLAVQLNANCHRHAIYLAFDSSLAVGDWLIRCHVRLYRDGKPVTDKLPAETLYSSTETQPRVSFFPAAESGQPLANAINLTGWSMTAGLVLYPCELVVQADTLELVCDEISGVTAKGLLVVKSSNV